MGNIENLKTLVREFPESAGVYLMKDIKTKIIYVGKAKNLRARVRSYFNNNSDKSLKTKFLVHHIEHIDYILTKTEVEAFLLEASLIKKYRPRYNIRLKDDKAYPYIRVSVKDAFPRFYVVRKVKMDGALYFGPYTRAGSVRESLRFLNRTFKIRDCRDSYMRGRTRPCMTYQIGRCTAPCVNLIDQEAYRKDINAAIEFLRGKDKLVLKELTQRMKAAASEERFEAAAKLRDSIEAVQAIWEKQSVIDHKKDYDQDVIAFHGDDAGAGPGTLIEILFVRAGRVTGSRSFFLGRLDATADHEDPREWLTSFLNQYYVDNIIPDEIIVPVDLGTDIPKLLQSVFQERQGKTPSILTPTGVGAKKLMEMALENAKAHYKDHVAKKDSRTHGLEDIKAKLHLATLPQRIECFDISNFQGANAVASQVVFEDGMPKSDDYRRYRIKTVAGPNDFASMKEVLTRRFKHLEYDDPDLVVIDGGKGQLSVALKALAEVGRPDIPVVGLAKARTLGEYHDSEIESSEERFFLPGRQNPVVFARNSEAYQILVGIRDEAHRFAITYYRKLQGQVSLESELDLVTGLGEKRKAQLLKEFGSVEEIRTSTAEEIAKLKGFNLRLARRILLQLTEDDNEPLEN